LLYVVVRNDSRSKGISDDDDDDDDDDDEEDSCMRRCNRNATKAESTVNNASPQPRTLGLLICHLIVPVLLCAVTLPAFFRQRIENNKDGRSAPGA